MRAVNKDGDSPDLTTDDFTAIKLPYEVPTPVIRQQERRNLKIPVFLTERKPKMCISYHIKNLSPAWQAQSQGLGTDLGRGDVVGE